MYLSWLDRWDERRVQRGNALKARSELVLDADLAFPGTEHAATLAEFCTLAHRASDDPSFFERPLMQIFDVQHVEDRLKFPSDIQTDIDENNVVWARVKESGGLEQALIVFHHWNAQKHQRHLANYFSKRGISVIEMALPYHFERRRPDSVYADYMLSANVGRTIQSVMVARDGPDGLIADISGVPHLFGGEAEMRADLHARLERVGLTLSSAIAETRGAAQALARHGGGILPEGAAKEGIASLPVSALRIGSDVAEGLARMGLNRIGDLIDLPRAPLARRFGQGLVLRLDQALGLQPEPVSPEADAPYFGVRMTLCTGEASTLSIYSAISVQRLSLQERCNDLLCG